MTYSMPVYISDDHFNIEQEYINKFIEQDINEKMVNNNLYEEMCILYVSLTRCAGEVELSEIVKRYLLLRYKTNGHELHSMSSL
jgi:hypothetical protein